MLSPGRRRQATARGRRNLILFGLIVAGVAALVVFVGISARAPKRIMPPESAEVTAKRESLDNSFNTILEAVRLLPNKQAVLFIPSESNSKAKAPYYVRPGSIGDILDIDRPDDDQALLAYLAACQPAIGKLREGLKKEYFLYPRVGTPYDPGYTEQQPYWSAFASFGAILSACMLSAARQPEREQQAVEYFSDAVRLAERLADDGGFLHYTGTVTPLQTTLWYVPDAAAAITSPDCLHAMRDALDALTLHERSAQPYLEFSWRSMDNWAEQGAPRQGVGGDDLTAKASDLAVGWVCSRQCRYLRKNKEQLLAAGKLSYREFMQCWNDGVGLPREGWMMPIGGLSSIHAYLILRVQIQNARAGVLIALSLELYQREHGQYPDSLDALVPGYLDVVPTGTSHSGDMPFVYHQGDDPKKAGDYWLYPGPERNDLDKMSESRRREAVIHCPAVETTAG